MRSKTAWVHGPRVKRITRARAQARGRAQRAALLEFGRRVERQRARRKCVQDDAERPRVRFAAVVYVVCARREDRLRQRGVFLVCRPDTGGTMPRAVRWSAREMRIREDGLLFVLVVPLGGG